jgi:hypothetical protein
MIPAQPPKTKGAAPGRLLPRTTILLSLFALTFLLHHANAKQSPPSDLTVHEWGTFTSIAGPDGKTMDWLPHTGSDDLPTFVEHFRDPQFKGGLRGTIRMETPVLYFYTSRPLNAFVHVAFRKGLITEWYPHAASVNPEVSPHAISLYNSKSSGAITWSSVYIDPRAGNDLPLDSSENHYYTARQTSAAPLQVSNYLEVQREKFLFYRGVAAFSSPLTATLVPDDEIKMENRSSSEIPGVILFERRGTKLGYRVLGPLSDQAVLATPALDGSLASLSATLEGILVSQGLFPDEAHAMLEAWKSSWFEEGSRLIYFIPRAFTDSVLPLSIKPAPANTTRVFVGRLELITPATQQAVESAFAANDTTTLAKYNRFLEPILRSMIQQATDNSRQQRLLEYLRISSAIVKAPSS